MIIFLLICVIGIGVLGYLLNKELKKNKYLTEENNEYYTIYKPIVDINREFKKVSNDFEVLKKDYYEKIKIYKELKEKIDLYSDDLEMLDVGIYYPIFDLETSTKYKVEIAHNRDLQKSLIRNKRAVTCSTEWQVSGSKAEGRKMIDRQIKLTLKAFNGQCDTIIKNVSWNNLKKMEDRIYKAYKDINKLNEPNHIIIEEEFLDLKIDELNLVYEYAQKKYEEKEEQKRVREQIREEEKLQKEIEKREREIQKQIKEEEELQRKLKEAFEKGQEAEAQKYQEEINKLQQVIEDSKRSVSQAQMTKVGHVYVISNIGSFGENIYKIGMTRRLEPLDRVDELGDASVPFKFDVHAMIKSDNAPELENKLHELFKNKSVNRVNYRKEFFKVSLDEVEKAVKEYTNAEISFTKIAEAREYRETLAIINQENNIHPQEKDDFPIEI